MNYAAQACSAQRIEHLIAARPRAPLGPVHSLLFLLSAVIILVGSAACSPRTTGYGPGVVARIDGDNLTYLDFERYVQAAGEDPTSLESSVMAALFLRFVDEQLLYRLAEDRRVLRRGESPALAAEALLRSLQLPEPDSERIGNYFAQHRSEFERSDRVVLRQMLLSTAEQAQAAREALDRGQPWQTVAREIAGDPSGSVASELSLEDLPPRLGQVIFSTAEGEVTPILEEDYGFHLFLVERRLAEGVAGLADVESEIRERLRDQDRDEAYEELLSEAWSSYTVEIVRTNLPFVLSEELDPEKRS